MTDPNVITMEVIAALAPTMAAIAAWIQSRTNAGKTDRLSSATNEISVKANEIHALTDGNLSKVTNQLAVAMERISGLEKLVNSMAITAAINTVPLMAVKEVKETITT